MIATDGPSAYKRRTWRRTWIKIKKKIQGACEVKKFDRGRVRTYDLWCSRGCSSCDASRTAGQGRQGQY
ncbi:hypothetical protein CEP51_001536 [Fusarium floridanum]|uniref:Uncharacterized protein n=1 Tax=Fusarium floridanum TaxID=1325733 RepID=A0A428SG60_9HYPO|nr:hypothetical protein CEP51_001536 [Fusarium floridanum]